MLLVTVALLAIGLGAANVTTYHFLGAFLVERLDDQLEAATRPAAARLTRAGPLHRGGHGLSLPDGGYYAALVDERGRTRREVRFAAGEDARPSIPAAVTRPQTGDGRPTLTTVPATSGETEYRMLAKPLRDEGTVIVALPLTEARATERRLLLIAGIASAIVLVAIGVAAYWLTRRELRPLEGMAERSAAIAAGDLSQRASRTTAARRSAGLAAR
jgi:two-component system OmpR family sensor kinase